MRRMKTSELLERIGTIKDILNEQTDNAAVPDLVEALDIIIDMIDMTIPALRKKKNLRARTKYSSPQDHLSAALDELMREMLKWDKRK